MNCCAPIAHVLCHTLPVVKGGTTGKQEAFASCDDEGNKSLPMMPPDSACCPVDSSVTGSIQADRRVEVNGETCTEEADLLVEP